MIIFYSLSSWNVFGPNQTARERSTGLLLTPWKSLLRSKRSYNVPFLLVTETLGRLRQSALSAYTGALLSGIAKDQARISRHFSTARFMTGIC